MNNVKIEYQDKSGNWMFAQSVVNTPQNISIAMNQISARFPNYRVRAVDFNGNLLNIS